jgi:putative ATP-binding cassette transporter
MSRQKKLTFFVASYSQASVVFPFIMVSPAYFANVIQLGGLMQTANAFGRVQDALSTIVTIYRSLAEWRAVVDRLQGFDQSIAAARAAAHTASAIAVTPDASAAVAFDALAVTLPDGAPLVDASGISIHGGERVLLSGPSGAGKSTLFRALAGVWPFGRGAVHLPANARVMILPQRPYFPIAPLAAAVAYPAEASAYDAREIADLVSAVGLPALAGHLEEEQHWNRLLSPGEQQRLGVARALLLKPDYLFLDEATASLDEPSEATLYRLLETRLPKTAIVSIGHRSTLRAMHRRFLRLVPEDGHHRLAEQAVAQTAEAAAG